MEENIIIASNGAEIIDRTPEAMDRIATMEYMETRIKREYKKKAAKRKRIVKNPLWRLAVFCGLV